jgi:hypothetical protein
MVKGGRRKGMGKGSYEMKEERRTEGSGGEVKGDKGRKRGGNRNRRSMKEDVPRELEMGSKRRKGFEREWERKMGKWEGGRSQLNAGKGR